tara:strand:+ start:41747 stop:42115 length:369 start_codon:yes stop_codon:yes gene_type:complete
MSSIGVALPLLKSSNDGFQMLKTIRQTVKQNLKMIILTNPGERVMNPEFGVGIKTYLFANFSEGVQSEIYDKIIKQVDTYLPAVKISKITFFETNPDTSSLAFQVYYRLPDSGLDDLLEFTI